MVENGTIPFAWFIMVALLWATTIFRAHKLLSDFLAEYPEVASREIPYAFSHFAHPGKAAFFWRKSTVELLRNNSELWRRRQHLIYFSIASLVLPFAGFVAILIYAVMNS